MSRCVVGVSGGVDSSVTLFLMKQAGFNVEAVYIKNWQDDTNNCPALEDCEYAMQVCDRLGVNFNTVDMTKAYKQYVFEDFLMAYASGQTPNPDVLCNRSIKFGACFDYLHKQTKDSFLFATGHYAVIEKKDGLFLLKKSADLLKDQTYFLHGLTQKQLSFSQFPLGGMQKYQVRALAKKLDFLTHDRKDSTGICLVGKRHMVDFLSNYLPSQVGDIVTPNGQIIGHHPGICFFTMGQRKGLKVGGLKNFDQRPWYVAEKDVATNQLIVVQGFDHPLLYHNVLEVENIHWISGKPPQKLGLKAKIRYQQKEQACVLDNQGEKLLVYFKMPQWGVSLGQFIVFYDGDICLGGGVINRRFNHIH